MFFRFFFVRGFIALLIFIFSHHFSAYAEDGYCWKKIKNLNAEIEWICEWDYENIHFTIDDLNFYWDGNTAYSTERKTEVIDGIGNLIIHSKQLRKKTVKIKSEFEKGILISDNITVNFKYDCIDDNCSFIALGKNVEFKGDIYEKENMANGSVVSIDSYFSGEFLIKKQNSYEYLVLNGEAVYCGGFKNKNEALNYEYQENCPFPNTYLDGTWASGYFIEGYGRFVFADGGIYEGNIHINDNNSNELLPDGYGKFLWVDGSKYFGEFKNGKRNGYGIYTYKDNSTYQGSWKNDNKNGVGRLYIKSLGIEYKGEFKNGLANGNGSLILDNNTRIIGIFKDNVLNGNAIVISKENGNTNVSEAVFKQGQLISIKPVKEQTSFNFFVSNAYAFSFFEFAHTVYEKTKKLYKWVKENKEHVVNFVKGCAGGFIGGAGAGAIGGAAAGTAIPVTGTALGAAIGGIAGGISGCINQGIKAFKLSKYEGKNYDMKSFIKSIKEEFNWKNAAIGATAVVAYSVAVNFGPQIISSLESKSVEIYNNYKRLKNLYNKYVKNIANKINKYIEGIFVITSWNLNNLSLNNVVKSCEYKQEKVEPIKKIISKNSIYTAIFAFQELKNNENCYNKLSNSGQTSISKIIGKLRDFSIPNILKYEIKPLLLFKPYYKEINCSGEKEYLTFYVNRLLTLFYEVKTVKINNIFDKNNECEPLFIRLKNRITNASYIIGNYQSENKDIKEITKSYYSYYSYFKLLYKNLKLSNFIMIANANLEDKKLLSLQNNINFCQNINYEKNLIKKLLNNFDTVTKNASYNITNNFNTQVVISNSLLCINIIKDYSKKFVDYRQTVSDYLPVTTIIKTSSKKIEQKINNLSKQITNKFIK